MWKNLTAIVSLIVMFFSSVIGLPLKDGSVQDNGYVYIDMEYGYHERHEVDLYLPKNSDGEVGLILYIHGGAWIAGSKDGTRDMALNYVETYGCAVAALNYRYISRIFDVNDELDDIDLCLARVKSKATEMGIKLNGVLLMGGSAGAHLSMLYAYARKNTAPITPKAVASYSGPTDLTDDNYYNDNPLGSESTMADLFSDACGKRFRYRNRTTAYKELMAVSPIAYVDEGAVPTIINHGAKDTVVPFSNAESIVKKFDKYGVKYDFNIFPNSNHGLESDPDNTKRAEELLGKYVKAYLGDEKNGGSDDVVVTEPTTQPTTETTTWATEITTEEWITEMTTTVPTQWPTEEWTTEVTTVSTLWPTQPTTVTTTVQPTTVPVTTAPTTYPTTQQTTVPTTVPITESDYSGFRIAKYRDILDNQEVYFNVSRRYADGSYTPTEFARNSAGDIYMNTTAEGMTMKLYYTKATDKMESYMYLSEGMVDEIMAGENEPLKIFIKGFVSLLDTTPLYTEVPENERGDMKMEEILDMMTIKNVGGVTAGKAYWNDEIINCEWFVDIKTGDTKLYYFDGDKLVGIDTFYKNTNLGMDRIIVHDVSNSFSDTIFKQPTFKINIPESLM